MPRAGPPSGTSEGFTKISEPAAQRTTIVDRRAGLDAAHRRWLKDLRGIDPEIAEKLGCCSVTLQFTNKRHVQAFLTPCLIMGHEVAWSARFDLGGKAMKGFVSSPDARLNLVFAEQLYEEDYLVMSSEDMPDLPDEKPERIVVLTEGQLDALSVRMAGFCGVSVPNGAKSLNWLERWEERLYNVRRLVLWLDDDNDGHELLETLLSKLAGNIYVARPPKEIDGRKIKDANDLLRIGGVEAIRATVLSAEMAISGGADVKMTRLLWPVRAFTTGIPWLDDRLVLCAGEHTALIGRAGRGKTKFANFLAYMAAKHNGQRVYFQSMEMRADGELSQDLAEIEMGVPIDEITADPDLYREALKRLQERVIALEPSRMPKSKQPLQACMNRIVRQANHGVHIHVVDNYSLVQSSARGKNANDQMREDILFINDVARRYNIAILVCYHARKPSPQYLVKNQPPELEDALGSSAIGNHCCLGVAIERVMQGSIDTNETNISVRKARRRIHGRRTDFSIYWEDHSSKFAFGSEGFSNVETGVTRRNKGKTSDEAPSNVVTFPLMPTEDPSKY